MTAEPNAGPYELIVFDWDGTLMNSEGRIVACMQMAAREVGLPVPGPREAGDVIGLGLAEAVRRLFGPIHDSQVDDVVVAYRTHWLGDEVVQAKMFDGAERVVASLHDAGFLLAVATGKSRTGLDRSLEESKLSHFFHATRCADETFSKPHPQMLQEILTDLDTAPADALVVGDTEYDVQMANNAGVAAVGISHGVHSSDRLLEQGARACFDDLPSLFDWIMTSPRSA